MSSTMLQNGTQNKLPESHLTVHVAMLGARGHYVLPRLLEQSGALGIFYTDIYLGNKPHTAKAVSYLARWMKHAALQKLQGRTCSELPSERIVSFDGLGLRIIRSLQKTTTTAQSNSVFARTNKAFGEGIVRHGLQSGDAVYCFNGAALEVFREARRRDMSCVLEQTAMPKRVENDFLIQEMKRWSGWEPCLEIETNDDVLAEREEAEWAAADIVISASTFVADNLRKFNASLAEKCVVIPYGIDIQHFRPEDLRPQSENRAASSGDTLNVLFVGRVNLQKGVPYLLEAMRALDSRRITCRLVGDVLLAADKLAQYAQWVEVIGSVPRNKMMEMFHWADVLVFPSTCDGFGMVMLEAMACGVPVIATNHTAAPDIITDGIEGFIVSPCDAKALARKIALLHEDTELRLQMSRNARRCAYDFSIEAYGVKLLKALDALIPKPHSALVVES